MSRKTEGERRGNREFCDATCACTCTHVSRCLCVSCKRPNANKSERGRKFMESHLLLLKSESQLHKPLSKAPMMSIYVMQSDSAMAVGLLQRCFFFFFKAFGIQATQKCKTRSQCKSKFRYVSYYLVHVYLCCLRRVDYASPWCSAQHFHLAARSHNIILNSLPLRWRRDKDGHLSRVQSRLRCKTAGRRCSTLGP